MAPSWRSCAPQTACPTTPIHPLLTHPRRAHLPHQRRPPEDGFNNTAADTERNNASIFDNNKSNQRLAEEDIEEMRRQGKVRLVPTLAPAGPPSSALPPRPRRTQTIWCTPAPASTHTALHDHCNPLHHPHGRLLSHPLHHPQAGTEIIDALCSNSATFAAKTEFSQVCGPNVQIWLTGNGLVHRAQ
jgi:hypothetical protein